MSKTLKVGIVQHACTDDAAANLKASEAGIRAAAARLQGQVLQTPCVESRTLSQLTGSQVFLKPRRVTRFLAGGQGPHTEQVDPAAMI